MIGWCFFVKSAIAAMHSYFELNSENISIETLFESIPVAVTLLDREGRHLVLNQALASISGLKYSDLVGRKVAELSKESGENIKRDFAFFDAGKDVPDHEVTIDDRIYLVSVKPIRNKSGFAFAEIAALTDITANKEIERQYKKIIDKLARSGNSYIEIVSKLEMESIPLSLNARLYLKSKTS